MQRLEPALNSQLIAVARGDAPADLLLTDAQVVNVFTGEVYPASVAIAQGRIAGFGDYEARETVSLKGKFLAPGFLDGHVHIESSMVTPEEYAQAVVPHGTTGVVCDPHEIANVLGIPGIEYMLKCSEGLPLDVYVMLSSCVPATHLEHAGASVSSSEIAGFHHPRVLGLAEMMNFPGVVFGDPEVLQKVHAAGPRRCDGHAPKLSGKQLHAYAAAGIESDHECTTPEEALEKLRLGMFLMLREGSVTRDLEPLLKVLTPHNMRRCLLVTDDREPVDLINEGHIDFAIRKAIRCGCDPVAAITMGSLNVAEYFGIRFKGAIAPGYSADIAVLEDLREIKVERVLKAGKWVAQAGKALWKSEPADASGVVNTVRLPALTEGHFRIEARGETAHVIELIPHQIVTGRSTAQVRVENGAVVADPSQDVLKLAVVERHRASGQLALGLVRGFGLQKGALAGTVGHDSHNLVVVGVSDADMLVAARHLEKLGGGLCVVADGEVKADLSLRVAGLMSDQPLAQVKDLNQGLIDAAAALGCKTPNPFMSLSFLALPVIPSLKLTDVGLVDVDKFAVIDLFEGAPLMKR